MYLLSKLQQDRRSYCNYKLETHKRAEITYLDGNKQQTRRHVRYIEISKLEKGCGWFSKAKKQSQRLMEHFQLLKANNKVCLVYLQCKLEQVRRS